MSMKYKLDTEAIRKRFAEAVVIGRGDGENIDIAIPFKNADNQGWYFFLREGLQASHLKCFPWTIRLGDMAEFSDGVERWNKCRYNGFSGYINLPFTGNDVNWKHIRPLSQTSPEKVKVMEQIAKMEKELAELKSRAEKLECKPC
jgi:hypothetical protein